MVQAVTRNQAGLFITGTDTDVGKTYIAALIAAELAGQGIRVGAYKPICCGSIQDASSQEVWSDVEVLHQAIGGRFPRDRVCGQYFRAAVAPSVAARAEGRTVDLPLLRTGAYWWFGRVEFLLVEGVGGLLCPLTPDETVADLAGDLGFHLIVVARNELGAINHVLLTIDVARQRGLLIGAVVLNDGLCPNDESAQRTNYAEIAARVDVPVLTTAQNGKRFVLPNKAASFEIDWLSFATGPGPH